jgi:hypothetical protein
MCFACCLGGANSWSRNLLGETAVGIVFTRCAFVMAALICSVTLTGGPLAQPELVVVGKSDAILPDPMIINWEKAIGHNAGMGPEFGSTNYQITEWMVGGLSVLETSHTSKNGAYDMRGSTVAPYADLIINNYLSVDMSMGYKNSNSGPDQTLGGIQLSEATKDSNDVWNWFSSVNLNAYYSVNKLNLRGRIGYIRSDKKKRGVTGNDPNYDNRDTLKSGRKLIDAQVGLAYGRIEPFIVGRYEYNSVRTGGRFGVGQDAQGGHRDGLKFGGGVRFVFGEWLAGGIVGSRNVGDEDAESTTLQGNIRISF